MKIGIVGVNFRSADLLFRERLAQIWQDHSSFLNSKTFTKVVLSTCNRFEIYFSSEDLAAAHSFLLQRLRGAFDPDCSFKLYSYFGSDCFHHLSRVTSGLDSAILAETEIQGQVKRAYLEALKGTLSKELHFIFQKSLKIGKKFRNFLEVSPNSPSLVDTILFFIDSLKVKISKPKVLFVGASQINLKIMSQMKSSEFEIYLCSRTIERAKEKAALQKAIPLPWEGLSDWKEYDGLIFATNYSKLLIKEKKVSLSREKLICDLSVPRNVNPQLSDHPYIKLYNIDQINKLIRRYRKFKSADYLELSKQIERAVLTQCSIFKEKTAYIEKIQSAS